MTRRIAVMIICAASAAMLVCASQPSIIELVTAQTRHPKRSSKSPSSQQTPRGSAEQYSAFLHSSEKHKSLDCNACHKIPTTWTAKRDFPDVADFPDHDACVRCHRRQFFTRQAFSGTGPAICTICHVRAGPLEDARFAFGKPNNAGQAAKPKNERQFTIEFPHDKHQNVIASLRRFHLPDGGLRFVRASLMHSTDNPKADYNNCSICHQTNQNIPSTLIDSFVPPAGTFKTRPAAHDVCFDCHWKSQNPTSDDCAGCHQGSAAFVPLEWPNRKSARFSHEGGKGEHMMECTTCHINITRASTLRGLTPDVPVTSCATCHKDSKKTTYPKIVTLEMEFGEFKKVGNCTYCHTSDVGKRKAPASHYSAVQ